MNDGYFTGTWVRGPSTGPGDTISPDVVRDDIAALSNATANVQRVGNLSVAHRQRVDPGELRITDIDTAFAAIETCLTKYYTLLRGSTLVGLEPAPQFNTLELYERPWIVPDAPDDESR